MSVALHIVVEVVLASNVLIFSAIWVAEARPGPRHVAQQVFVWENLLALLIFLGIIHA